MVPGDAGCRRDEAPGGAPVVVGYQRRFHGVSRGFVAKLVP